MDNLSPADRRKNMQNVRSVNTQPELMVIKELKKRKIYFTHHVKKIYGNPDIVFRRKRVVIFIDSDFWHFNQKYFIMPKTNTDYWEKKIKKNVERDNNVNKILSEQGWKILRFWESEIKKNIDKVIEKILLEINR